jgi:trans-aconitate 2-methyltransferase
VDGRHWPRPRLDVVRYTFGDDEPAIARLALVAGAYAPISGAFIAAHVPDQVDSALDLGCGPGFSTILLAESCRPQGLVGLDSSAQFLESARRRVPHATFQTHDATSLPLPATPATVIYARLLLAHLPDPARTAERWASALAPGGVLLVEDLERIEAPPGPLRRYDAISAEVVRTGGGLMYAGPELARLGGHCVPVTVPAALAATIYPFNVRRWLADANNRVPEQDLRSLKTDLESIATSSSTDVVSWIVRQLAIPAER